MYWIIQNIEIGLIEGWKFINFNQPKKKKINY